MTAHIWAYAPSSELSLQRMTVLSTIFDHRCCNVLGSQIWDWSASRKCSYRWNIRGIYTDADISAKGSYQPIKSQLHNVWFLKAIFHLQLPVQLCYWRNYCINMLFVSPLHLSLTDTNHIDTVSLNTASKKKKKNNWKNSSAHYNREWLVMPEHLCVTCDKRIILKQNWKEIELALGMCIIIL